MLKTTEEDLIKACSKVLRWRSALDFGNMYNRLRYASDEDLEKVVQYLRGV